MIKKTIFPVLLMLSVALANAQTKLAGRTYYNANIMTNMMDKIMRESEAKKQESLNKAIAEEEKKKGRKLNAEEKEEIKKKMEKAIAVSKALAKGMKTALTFNFKDEKRIVIDTDMTIDEEAMKNAGANWLERKTLKAALSVTPTFKGEYIVKDNLVIIYDGKEPSDTTRISPDGKQLYGKMDNIKYTLTRIK